ncbi:protein RGF1 INDUCIBLE TRANSCRIPTION FACTOR 1-like [Trifolium pratense]|uniref:protein RGF1 INDUCIBLE TRANSCRIPTION FACTOR 1-like n=1 Tax=Trifolium pratense TaxID=57577 RepID=UPI000844FF2E|nr:protein RGF1 INDUCIBLE TRANSCRIPTION FACTOR 1-like [Trifolium pratense]
MRKYNLPNERKKVWLDALLKENFGNCKNHQEKNNEKNVFCVDCRMSLCKHGIESHFLHKRFQIYQYSYQDVVKYSDILKYFDCSNIQTYKSNKDTVVHLKPRPSKEKKLAIEPKVASLSHGPQVKETKTSTPHNKFGGICEECGKHLQDKRNRFCSLTCKMSIIEKLGLSILFFEELGDQNDHNQNSEAESSISIAEPYRYVEKVNFRKHPRKNTPMRSFYL